MRVGTMVAIPNEYSQYGRIVDEFGTGFSIEAGDVPEKAEPGKKYAYKVEIWSGDSGLAYDLKEG